MSLDAIQLLREQIRILNARVELLEKTLENAAPAAQLAQAASKAAKAAPAPASDAALPE